MGRNNLFQCEPSSWLLNMNYIHTSNNKWTEKGMFMLLHTCNGVKESCDELWEGAGVGYMGKVEGRKGKGENDVMKIKKTGNRSINIIKHKRSILSKKEDMMETLKKVRSRHD